MSGLTLHCGLEGGRRHVPSWSDICGIRLELASFDWRGFTLPVSVVFVFSFSLTLYFQLGAFQDRSLLPHYFPRLGESTYQLLYEEAYFSLLYGCCIEIVFLAWMQYNSWVLHENMDYGL